MRRVICLIVILLSISSPVFAWHDAGHRIIAAIAFRRLNDSQQRAVVALLKQHPRFQDEFANKMPEGLDEREANTWVFTQAAVFPDIVRQYQGELKDKFHHSTWHYINIPEFLSPADRVALKPEDELNIAVNPPAALDEQSNIIQTIRVARRTLADKTVSAEQRAILVPWLMHLVGDIHQPLHSTALFSQHLFPKGDRGGNSVLTTKKDNLHALWDSFPGGRVDFKTVDRRTATFMADMLSIDLGQQAAADLDEENWLAESRKLAVTDGYDSEVRDALRLLENSKSTEKISVDVSEDYCRRGAVISEKRVVQAGYRLGAILSELFE